MLNNRDIIYSAVGYTALCIRRIIYCKT